MVEVKMNILLAFRRPHPPVHILSIPHGDVERLAIFPFRWLRYVVFTICGARGNFHTMNDHPVDYDNTEVDNDQYVYVPSESFAFIDSEGLNDRITSTGTSLTENCQILRNDIIRRDGQACVVSRAILDPCDAVHLIPRSKGDEYIGRVIKLRSRGDNIGINDTRNGMLLSKNLHPLLGKGTVAFIETPNYGLRPEDIVRCPQGGPRQDYITLQWLKRSPRYDPTLLEGYSQSGQQVPPALAIDSGLNIDAVFQSEGGSLPSPVILDYVYGVAAYKCWRSSTHVWNGGVPEVMSNYCKRHYARISPRPPTSSDDAGDAHESGDDLSDPDYIPRAAARKRYPSKRRDDLVTTMDELNVLLMRISGTTPEQIAERRQKEIEQRERAAREVSRSMVMKWRLDVQSYCLSLLHPVLV